MHYFFKNLLLYSQAKIRQTQVCSRGRVYQNCKFHDPRGRGSCSRVWQYTCKSYSENALFLLKSSSLLPGIDQTNYVYSIDDQGRVYPGAGVLLIGGGHISQYSEYVVTSTLSIYSTLVAIMLRDYVAAFLFHC